MKSMMRGQRRNLHAAAAMAMSTAALLVGFVTPAHASDTTSTPDNTSVGDTEMGSQIRLHEGSDKMLITPNDFDPQATVQGIDVSSHQGNVDWASYWNQGKRFAYVKATENTNYTNPFFAQQYNGSFNVGMIRGAYHFATPNTASGAAQADWFSSHGGGWSADGRTLPGALDMEYNPYGSNICYGLSKAAMTNWILDFSNTYHARWSKWPAIYTSTSWWSSCVSGDFSSTNPLWVARYASSVGTLPCCWGFYTFWQFSSTPIDQTVFNGALDRLQVFATAKD
jgi:GH25 family lysozyme M1 (1,4-beta-N-acetylmuramidase)